MRSSLLIRHKWSFWVAWTLLIALSIVWNITKVKSVNLENARIQARAAFDKDILYRRWNSRHSGVYVPITEETPPNPYLPDTIERDIKTPSGKTLTLINPAYMTRQVHELGKKQFEVLGHITSLKPIRPQNTPDPWETRALQKFERGETEVSSLEKIKGIEYIRLMRPLFTEKFCLKCHSVQGYKEGDIRGGISVAVPMKPIWAVVDSHIIMLSLAHFLLWLIGMCGIGYSNMIINRSEERLRRICDATFEGIAITERGEIIDANPQFAKMIGYSLAEIKDKSVSDFVVPEHRDLVFQHIKEDYQEAYEHVALKKDGSRINVEVRGKQTFYKGRRVRETVIRDITERKKAEEQIKTSLKEKEILISEIHHRVKNNMAVIISLLYMQSGYIKDEQYKEMFLESINRIKTMGLIHEKLYRSKDLTNVYFDDYIKSILDYISESYILNTNKITIKTDIERILLGIDTSIPCGLIVNELISNSLKYAFPEGREGEIKVAIRTNDNDEIELTVGDNGVGFPEGIDFKTSDSLGLTVVNALVKQLRGKIEVPRKQGTEFRITFRDLNAGKEMNHGG